MRMRLCLLIMIAVSSCLVVLQGCHSRERIYGNGIAASEKRVMPCFNAVRVDGDFEIILVHDTIYNVAIETDQNVLKVIHTEVIDGQLSVYSNVDIIRPQKLRLVICSDGFNKIETHGASILESENIIKTRELQVKVSGTAVIRLNADATVISCSMDGGTELSLGGKTRDLIVEIEGSGQLDGTQLMSDYCKLDISGVGKASVHAVNRLDVNAAGAAKVRYQGNPKIYQSLSGTAVIEKI